MRQQQPSDSFKETIRQKLDKETTSEITDRDQKVWEGVYASIQQSRKRKHQRIIQLAVAASLLCIISITAYLYLAVNKRDSGFTQDTIVFESADTNTAEEVTTDHNQPEKQTQKSPQPQDKTKKEKDIPATVTHQSDQDIMTKTLSDGSVITLNKQTSLHTTASSPRNINLHKGEALFDIAHDPSAPFFVYFDKHKLEVLGTTFNILHDPDKGNSEVTVIEGTVRVYTRDKKIILNKGQQLTLSPDQEPVRATVNAANYISWKTGDLMFEETPLHKITTLMSRTYGQKIESDQAIEDCNFTVNFTGMQLDEALKILSLSGNLTIDKNDDTIHLSGSSCN